MLIQNQIPNNEMTPRLALSMMKEGNKRFVENHLIEHDLPKEVKITSNSPQPFALVLNCFDSRLPAELIFDLGIGDIFNIRIAGNIINDDIIGSMEFACKYGGSKLIVVLGHTSCEAVKAVCNQVKLGKLSGLLKKIEVACDSIATTEGTDRSSMNNEFVNLVAQKNVELTLENIQQQSPLLKNMIENDEINLIGAMYNLNSGEVTFNI